MALTIEELGAFLSQMPPREIPKGIPKSGPGAKVILVLGVFFALFGGVFVFIFFPWNIMSELKLMTADCGETTGEVVSSRSTSMKVNDRRVHEIAFRFSTEETADIEGVCYATGSSFGSGRTVTVRYVKSDPRIAVIEGCTLDATGVWGLFVLIFPLAGVGMAAGGLIARARRVRILRDGAFATGSITDVVRENSRVNDNWRYAIHVSYLTEQGEEHGGTFHSYDRRVIALARSKENSGEDVGVLYDPASPKRVIVCDSFIDPASLDEPDDGDEDVS